MTKASPRIPPLPVAERDEVADDLLSKVGLPGANAMNIFTTLVRHPRLFRRWLPFAGVLLAGSLPAHDRELLILRTAHRCGAAYEWAHHLRLGREAGLDDTEIERVRLGPEASGWSPFDATLLRAVDEMHMGQCIEEATWAALAERYDQRQLIEVPMLVGHYHLLAFTLNSLGVQVEGSDGPG